MYLDKKIVVVTPAGRKRYLEVLFLNILKLREIIDEYRLWVNTTNKEDIVFMEAFQREYPDFVTLEYLTIPYKENLSIYSFFKNCIDHETVYIRFDDDIVMIDTLNSFKNFIKFRIESEYFLVYANILNNAVISNLHNRSGRLNTNCGFSGYACMDDIGWGNSKYAYNIHEQVLEEDNLETFKFDLWVLKDFERVSINCISWLGKEFKKFGGIVHRDEELWLSCIKPTQLSKCNVIYGNFVVVHFAFHTQREFLDCSNLLSRYLEKTKNISNDIQLNEN